MTMLTTPDQINMYRVLTLRAGLRLEVRGMKLSRGLSCYALIKNEFGFKGNKAKVLDQMNAFIDEATKE